MNGRPPADVTTGVTPRLAHALVGGALALMTTVLAAGPASAHGAPTSPLSRSAACGAEGTGAEGSAQDAGAWRAALDRSPQLVDEWDNVRVAGVRGRDYSCSDVDFAAATGSVATAGGAGADGAPADATVAGTGSPAPPAENTIVSHGIGVHVAVVGGAVLMTATAAGGLALARRTRRRRDS